MTARHASELASGTVVVVPRTDTHRGPWFWAVVLAAFAPVAIAFLIWLSEVIGEAGTRAVVVAPMVVLGVLAAASMIASGIVGGPVRGAVATAAAWVLITAFVYVALDPSCDLEMSRAPHGVAAINPSSAAECLGGEAPTRGNNVGFVVLGGIFATMVAFVGGLIGTAGRWCRRSSW